MQFESVRVESLRWLAPHMPALMAAGDRVLEAGCGERHVDGDVLAEAGFTVFAFDRSLPQPTGSCGVHAFVADLTRPLPLVERSVDVVLASLCLHYFPWETTVRAVGELRRVVCDSGLLLVRVNATDDVEHGAGAGVGIEPGFYRQTAPDGIRYKRFFDDPMLRAAVGSDFDILRYAHMSIDRYGTDKRVWECAARPRPTSRP
jgi:hypothetical protein